MKQVQSDIINCSNRLGKQVSDNVHLLRACKQDWARYVHVFLTRTKKEEL
jgi:hypothetical protein